MYVWYFGATSPGITKSGIILDYVYVIILKYSMDYVYGIILKYSMRLYGIVYFILYFELCKQTSSLTDYLTEDLIWGLKYQLGN